jgi:protease I
MPDLSSKRIAILTTDGVEETELTEPMKALKDAGATVEVLSPEGKPVQLMSHIDKTTMQPSDARIADRSPDTYDAIVLPGGVVNADALRMSEDARQFVRTFNESGKPIAAICHAPWVLVSSGVLDGRKLTSYYTVQDDIRNAGATWVDEEVVEDGNLITSRSPKDLPAFNGRLIEALSRIAATATTPHGV